MKYRKKPVIIDAFQYKSDEFPQWFNDMDGWEEVMLYIGDEYDSGVDVIEIDTLEGKMKAYPSDFIIRGLKGELYPCKPDIFQMTYESLEDSE